MALASKEAWWFLCCETYFYVCLPWWRLCLNDLHGTYRNACISEIMKYIYVSICGKLCFSVHLLTARETQPTRWAIDVQQCVYMCEWVCASMYVCVCLFFMHYFFFNPLYSEEEDSPHKSRIKSQIWSKHKNGIYTKKMEQYFIADFVHE